MVGVCAGVVRAEQQQLEGSAVQPLARHAGRRHGVQRQRHAGAREGRPGTPHHSHTSPPLLLSAVSLTWPCACLSAVLARLRLVRCPDPGRDLHHQGRPERQDARVQAGDAAGRAARVHEHVAGRASWGEANHACAAGGRARRRRVQAVRMGLPPLGQFQPYFSVFGGFVTVYE